MEILFIFLEWKCESGDYFGWEHQYFVGYEISSTALYKPSIHDCRAACDKNDHCRAFSYFIETQECTLRSNVTSFSSRGWSEADGLNVYTGYNCTLTPESSPERDPDFYLWSSCANQYAQGAQNSPQCTPDGEYQPRQCDPLESGRCWCVDQFGDITPPLTTGGNCSRTGMSYHPCCLTVAVHMILVNLILSLNFV